MHSSINFTHCESITLHVSHCSDDLQSEENGCPPDGTFKHEMNVRSVECHLRRRVNTNTLHIT